MASVVVVNLVTIAVHPDWLALLREQGSASSGSISPAGRQDAFS
jgi:hypothetical protein